jgi:hypothetical protein
VRYQTTEYQLRDPAPEDEKIQVRPGVNRGTEKCPKKSLFRGGFSEIPGLEKEKH